MGLGGNGKHPKDLPPPAWPSVPDGEIESPQTGNQAALAKRTITPRASSKAMGTPNAPERVSGRTGPFGTGTWAQAVESHAHVVVWQAVRSQAELSCSTSMTRALVSSYPVLPAQAPGRP